MADFYFFTDSDLLPTQTTNQQFGADSTNPTLEYKTWAAFTGIESGTQLKAYAVTNGEFFLQEVQSSNLLNLVLKPDTQPTNKIGLIKYFVYRGIKKDSFLNNDGSVLVNNSNLNDLLSRIWEVRESENVEAGISEIVTRNDLGLDEIGTSTPLPSSMLIKEILEKNVFQRISAGWHIGDFDTTGEYGFQVILESPVYRPTLEDLRVLNHKINISYVPNQPQFANQEEEDIKTKLDREKILSFIDPVAYFGLLSFEKIKVYKSSTLVTISNNPASFYTEIISKFATKNRVYVDIRNELNNSINFYGSYSEDSLSTKVAIVKFMDNSNSLVNKEYHSNGWPILTLDITDFISSNSNFTKAEFQLPKGDNLLPSLFLSGASFFADELNYKEKFQVLNITGEFTGSIELSVANNASASIVLPYYLKFSLTRRYDIQNLEPIPQLLKRPWKDDYLDTLLALNEVNISPLDIDPNFLNTIKWQTCNELKYIGWTSLRGFDFTVKSGIAKDSFGTTLFAYISGDSEIDGTTKRNQTHFNLPLKQSCKVGNSFYKSLFQDYRLITVRSFSLQNPNIDTIQVDSIAHVYAKDIIQRTFDDLFSISFSTLDENEIQSLTNNLINDYPIYISFFNHELKNDANDTAYFECEMGLQGVEYNPISFDYNVKMLTTDIKLYSLDGRHYFSLNMGNVLHTLFK